MSATANFARWAKEVAEDPRYPAGLSRDIHTVALYVALTEALAEATRRPGGGFVWMPSAARARHFVN